MIGFSRCASRRRWGEKEDGRAGATKVAHEGHRRGRKVTVAAVRELRRLGVLAREKTRLRVRWGLGVASRQGRNIYRLLAGRTEVAGRRVVQSQEMKKVVLEVVHVVPAAPGPDLLRLRRQAFYSAQARSLGHVQPL